MAVFGPTGGCEGICVAILRRGEDTRAFVWQFEGEGISLPFTQYGWWRAASGIANPISSVSSIQFSCSLEKVGASGARGNVRRISD